MNIMIQMNNINSAYLSASAVPLREGFAHVDELFPARRDALVKAFSCELGPKGLNFVLIIRDNLEFPSLGLGHAASCLAPAVLIAVGRHLLLTKTFYTYCFA